MEISLKIIHFIPTCGRISPAARCGPRISAARKG